MVNFKIGGCVKPGFEPVRLLFEENLRSRYEDNAQVCVYVDNVKVIDLWGSSMGDDEFHGDKQTVIFR